MIKPGRYRHYKGGVYIVLFTAQDSETTKSVVVYMNEVHGTYYTRPLKEFSAYVLQDDEDGGVPRFKLIEETNGIKKGL
jgi:hypothetical protein